MAGKLPRSQKIKRSAFATDAEFIKALIAAGRSAEAENYSARKGISV